MLFYQIEFNRPAENLFENNSVGNATICETPHSISSKKRYRISNFPASLRTLFLDTHRQRFMQQKDEELARLLSEIVSYRVKFIAIYQLIYRQMKRSLNLKFSACNKSLVCIQQAQQKKLAL